jgi:tetratricopeptide (TPR) repeat protein
MNQELLPIGKRLTILTLRQDIDVRLEFPRDLPHENLVLLLNDLHKWYEEGRLGSAMRFGTESEPFHRRLQKVISDFERWTQGRGMFRIIATARSEPEAHEEFWGHISNDSFWKTFTIVQLQGLHSTQVSGLIDAAAAKFGDISVTNGAKEILADRNNGTFNSIILYLTGEKTKGSTVIDEERAGAEFTAEYRKDWETKVYIPFIQRYPARVNVLSALDLLDRAGVPFIKEVVIELAARLWHGRYPMRWRRRSIRKALVALQSLIQESEIQESDGIFYSILSCHEAYFENRGDLVAEISTITSTLLAMTHNRQLRHPLFNPVFNFGLLLEDAYYNEQAARVFAGLAKLYPTSAVTCYEYGKLLFWEGYMKRAERVITQAISLDPSDPRYHAVHADILSVQAMFTEAVPHYKAAIRLASHWDADTTPWMLFNYADNLNTLGRKDEAISCVEQFLDMSPNYVSARCILALMLKDKGEQDKAREQANLATQLRPWTPTGYKNVARVHRRFDNPQEAIERYSEAIKIGRDSAAYVYDAYFERALCHIQLGDQQSAHQDLAMARKAASTLTHRCPNNFDALYTLAFIYLIQGNTRRAIRTLRRAQTTCALPTVKSYWAEETRRLGDVTPSLTGYIEFRDALDPPERTRHRIIPSVHKLMEILHLIGSSNENLGSRLEPWDPQADLKIIQDHVIRMKQDFQDETIEILDQGVLVSLPHAKDSINSISFMDHNEYFDLNIYPSEGLLFSDRDVVFTKGTYLGSFLPVMSRNKLRAMEQAKDNTITQFVISIPYNSGSIKQISHIVSGNYLHVVLYGSIASSFNESKVKFARFPEKASTGDQQESGSTGEKRPDFH